MRIPLACFRLSGIIEKDLPNREKTNRPGGLEHANDIYVLRHTYLDVLL
jgi:hypothetical protein